MLGFLPQEVPVLYPAARRSRHSSLSALIASSPPVGDPRVRGRGGHAAGRCPWCDAVQGRAVQRQSAHQPFDERPRQEGHHDRDQGDRQPEAGRRQLADDLRGQGGVGQQLVPDQRDQRQERQVALRGDLPVRGRRSVQDLRPAARDQVRRLPGEPALERVDECHLSGRDRYRHEGAGHDAGDRVVLSTTCSGKAVSGKSWYRISSVNGKSVKSLYGVTYLYSATGLYKSTVTTRSGAPRPRPRIRPPLRPRLPRRRTPKGSTSATGRERSTGPRSRGRRQALRVHEGHPRAPTSSITTYVTEPSAGARRRPLRRRLSLRPAQQRRRRRRRRSGPFHQHGRSASAATCYPSSTSSGHGSLSQTALTNWVKAFLARVEERIGVRGDHLCLAELLADVHGRTRPGSATTATRSCGSPIGRRASRPIVPGGNWGGDGWTFWQYTSDGAVHGITGRVDLNRYRGTNFTPVLIP